MPIKLETSPSSAKSWSPKITASASGLTIDAFDARFVNRLYRVRATEVPCTEPGSYRLVLCLDGDGAVLVLERDGRLPDSYDEVIYFARWTLRAGQTCADVDVWVVERQLIAAPPTVIDTPEYEEQRNPETGEVSLVITGTKRVEVPAEPLPDPQAIDVLPGLRRHTPSAEEQIAATNAVTARAIEAGYEFRGLRFSLSLHHQINLTQLYMTRNTPLAGLPVTLANIDDTAWITLTKPEDIEEMAMAMCAAKRAAFDAGNAAKRAVKEG